MSTKCNDGLLHCQALFHSDLCKQAKIGAARKPEKAKEEEEEEEEEEKAMNARVRARRRMKKRKRQKRKGPTWCRARIPGNHTRYPRAGSKGIFSESQRQNLACRIGKATPGPNSETEIFEQSGAGRKRRKAESYGRVTSTA
jgi:hypothetical protein